MINLSNTQHWLIKQAEKNPNSIAIITSDGKLSYKELFEKSLLTSSLLNKQGIKEGNHVGILFSHNQEFWILINALWFCGAIPVPLNIRLTNYELSYQIEKAKISSLIIEDNLKELSKSFSKIKIIFLSQIKYNTITNHQPSTNKYQLSTFDYQRLALIMFTSGSSGKSKAVVHTFENIYESVSALDSFADLSNEDIWLASLPFYHIGGFMILSRALIAGSSVAIPKSLKYNDIKISIQQFQPTHLSLVSTTLFRFLKEKFQPTKNIKYAFLGGGYLDPLLCTRAYQNGWNIVKVYGSTETCSMITALRSSELEIKPESAGKPLKNVQIKIVDESYSSLQPFQKGEIAVYSKTLFKEYYSISENSKLQNGCFLTGDYGWLDNDGYLFIDARREDIIITGGENVSAKEVEDAIKKLNAVKDAFVFAEEDELWGQSVSAVLVTIKNIDSSDIKKSLSKILASYKIPKSFYFISEIPRTELGKVDREKLMRIIKVMKQD